MSSKTTYDCCKDLTYHTIGNQRDFRIPVLNWNQLLNMLSFYNKNTTAIELLLKAPTTNISAGNRKPPPKRVKIFLDSFGQQT